LPWLNCLVIFGSLPQARGVLILNFLLLPILDVLLAAAMSFEQAVKSLYATALVEPLALTCGGALLGLSNQSLCLHDGFIEPE